MTTPRDILFTALDTASGRTVDRGGLSLALAGAELIDLITTRAVALDGDHIVPADERVPEDALLQAASSALVREAPYETVEDWLWRRGRDLAAAYLTALEAEGLLTRRRSRWTPFRAEGEPELVDSSARRQAADRSAAREPVLTALAAALGVHDEVAPDADADTDAAAVDASGDLPEGVEAVLAAVGDAELELAAVRQRRDVEQAAFDNIWRAV